MDQWKALLRILNTEGKGHAYAQKVSSMSLAKILVASCPSQKTEESKSRSISYASAVEPLEALTAWIVAQLRNAGALVSFCIPALTVLMSCLESHIIFVKLGGIKYVSCQVKAGSKESADNKKFGQGSVQLLYELSFCLWILTYELNTSQLVRADFAKDGVPIQTLVEIRIIGSA